MALRFGAVECPCEDSENRMKRNNLNVYGHHDTENDTWAGCEQLVLDMCSEKLGSN